jgi:hypothetical protein
MIDIPLGKALVPVKLRNKNCEECCFIDYNCNKELACIRHERKDGKPVIFKLVDYPVKEEL